MSHSQCTACGTQRREGDKFCHECGAPFGGTAKPAEYKQVTVLFADVVRSMDIAASVGAERLREIMTELVTRATAFVKRYGGTVDKFTGDGIMAVFGAPVALEDHAFRACLAALGIQEEAQRLASEVERDGVELRVRVGLNSGQVIAGEIGSAALGYTAIGEQVGMAQRMESVAPPGGVMLTESTARLVEHLVLLGEPELVGIKGAETPLRARRLLGVGDHQLRHRGESALIGRSWEINTITGILDDVIGGSGYVITLEGPPGIGKSRLVRETTAIAAHRGVPVSTIFCESHASDVPFQAVSRLLRTGMGIESLDAEAARARAREQFVDADPEDLLLLDDLLGIRDSATPLPEIAPDARRRRLTALIIGASLARKDPAVYVIEDAQWVDEVSESMLADFFAVIPQTTSLVLITHRPEYRDALMRVSGAQNLALRPLNDAQTSALTAELLGADPSLSQLATQVATRAAGNPFFAEEMVRDLAERGVLRGQPGAYQLRADVADVEVPATLQATIGARIDRLGATAKQTLNAAAVIGARFDMDLLTTLVDTADVAPLIEAELVDQVRFSAQPEYVFHHPLIRTVAYESQLKSDRAQLHRRLAAAIDEADENAALIAEHYEAAGDLHAAFDWHMRAGTWSAIRDIPAAQTSWRRARQAADRLPDDDPDRVTMRIAPRTVLCGVGYQMGGRGVDSGFDELRELCIAAGDQRSLAIGMSGPMMEHFLNARRREASRLATEQVRLVESIGDPMLTIGLLSAASAVKVETVEVAELLPLVQHIIDLAEGDPVRGNFFTPSPLAIAIGMRGFARWCLGMAGWKDDFGEAASMAHGTGAALVTVPVIWYTQVNAIVNGVLLPDESALRETAEYLAMAEQSAGDTVGTLAQNARGLVMIHRGGEFREQGLELLSGVRDTTLRERYTLTVVPLIDTYIAREKILRGDLDGAIGLSRTVVDELFAEGGSIWNPLAADVFVDALLRRGIDADIREAHAVIDRLAAMPTDPGVVLNEIWLLRMRARVARSRGDEAGYRDLARRYLRMATDLGFEGHIAMAEAMT